MSLQTRSLDIASRGVKTANQLASMSLVTLTVFAVPVTERLY